MFRNIRIPLIVLLTLCFSVFLHAQQLISGSASVVLSGPATKEVTLQAQSAALKSFRAEILQWLINDIQVTIDTANAVQRASFNMFADSCRIASKSETAFKGKDLTLAYLLTTEQAQTVLQKYNEAVDAHAFTEFNKFKEACTQFDIPTQYSAGMRALFFSLAHLGISNINPDSGKTVLAADVLPQMQKFFDKMNVSSSGMILAGKTGLAIQDPPTITMLVDSLPFSGAVFTGKLQNGTILFSSPTSEQGKILIDNFKMPFVPNGTLLEACINPAQLIGITGFLDPAHFGLRLNRSQVQTYIFKVTKPIYTLEYKASSVSNITMPPDFANVALVKKFLQDSCFLLEGTNSKTTDLTISINTQVSSYSYDETEELGIKVSSQIIVNGLLLQPPRTNKQQFVFEKRYGSHLTPPYGLYFWEANGKLHEAIKAAIAGL